MPYWRPPKVSAGGRCATASCSGEVEAKGGQTPSNSSERIPGGVGREADVADVGAEAEADAGADRGDDDVAVGGEGGADAADQIGRAVDAGEAGVDVVGRLQPVDQEQRLGAVG